MTNAKKILISFSTILTLMVCSILWIIGKEKYHLYVFEKTELQISQTELEKLWGKSDKVVIYPNGGKSIFYYTTLNEFVFSIDESEKLEYKYKDNF